MRILMISDFYPPHIGGMERHVQVLSRELVRRGHHVAVATLWHEGHAPVEMDEDVRVYRLRGWSRLLAPFYERADRQFHPTVPDPGIVAGLRRVVAAERPEIVHARGWMLYSYLPLKSGPLPRLVVTLHDYGLVCPKKTYLRDGHACTGPSFHTCVSCGREQYGAAKSLALTAGLRASSLLHGRVDRYIAISMAVHDAGVLGIAGDGVRHRNCLPSVAGEAGAASHGDDPPRRDATAQRRQRRETPTIDVIPTFIPDDALDADATTARPAFLPPEDGYLLFVGALGRHKGLHTLLEAYAGLCNAPPLVVIGTARGDTPRQFPSGVVVARDVPHAQVMAAWARCAISVVPSLWPEPFGQVAIEAMACGKPVVASDTGGLRDAIVDGESGLLVPPGDVAALREALRMLLSDPARRERMGAAGRARARQFLASTVTDRIERLYTEMLTNQ